MTIDPSSLSDDELHARIDAARSGAEPEPAAEPTEPEPLEATQEPTAEPAPAAEPAAPATEPEPHVAQGQEQNRGDLNIALQQERDRRRQAEARWQDPNAMAQALAQLGYQVVPQQQQEIPDPQLDPEGFVAYQQQQLQAVQQSTAQQMQQFRLEQSEALARISLPDYDAVIARLDGLPVNWDAILSAPSPAIAAYQLGQRLGSAQSDQQAAIQAEAKKLAEKMVAEARAKEKAPPPTVNGVARAGSVNPDAPVAKKPDQMSDSELNEARDAARRKFITR